jgi:capsular polysaccharide biosynthesis protein
MPHSPGSIFAGGPSLSLLERVFYSIPRDRGAFKVWLKGFVDGLWRESPKVCANVKAWAEEQPDTVAELIYAFYANPEAHDRSLPKTLEQTIDPMFLSMRHQEPVEKYLVKLSQAQLIGNSGLVILPDGQYTLEPALSDYHLKQLAEYYSGIRHRFLKRRSVKGNYFPLMQLWASATNYYHTIHDNMHRLEGLLEHLPTDIIFVVPDNLRPWQWEILSTLGIEADRCMSISTTEILDVETLYFTPHGTPWEFDTPRGYQWGRQQFYDRYEVESKPPQKLLYISRELAHWRRPTNEKEVEAMLTRYGFEKCLPETMTIAQQVNLFAQARAVVSVKGAAMTNLMFCPAGTEVLEIQLSEYDPLGPCFWFMCEHMDHHYSYVVGETVKTRNSIYRGQKGQVANREDLYVPIDKLERSVQRLLEAIDREV